MDDAVSVFVEELEGALVSFEEDAVEPAESVVAGGVTAVGVVAGVVFVFDLLVRAGEVEALELVVVLADELG